MSLETNGMSAADVAAVVGNNRNDGFGFGGDGGYLLLFFLLMMCGGWGNGFGGNMFGYGNMWNMEAAPYFYNMQTQNEVARGFDQSATTNALNGLTSTVTSGFAGVNQGLCNSTANITQSIMGAQNTLAQQLYSNEIGSLNRSFAEQTANAQGFNSLNAGVADLRYTVATEACADRAAVGDALQNVTMQNMGNTNQLISVIRDGIQSIKDDLCADRLAAAQRETEAERRENANLRTQLNMAAMQNGFNAETDALYNRLKSCPIPSQPVYGNQPIFNCPNNAYNYGCGCNG